MTHFKVQSLRLLVAYHALVSWLRCVAHTRSTTRARGLHSGSLNGRRSGRLPGREARSSNRTPVAPREGQRPLAQLSKAYTSVWRGLLMRVRTLRVVRRVSLAVDASFLEALVAEPSALGHLLRTQPSKLQLPPLLGFVTARTRFWRGTRKK